MFVVHQGSARALSLADLNRFAVSEGSRPSEALSVLQCPIVVGSNLRPRLPIRSLLAADPVRVFVL